MHLTETREKKKEQKKSQPDPSFKAHQPAAGTVYQAPLWEDLKDLSEDHSHTPIKYRSLAQTLNQQAESTWLGLPESRTNVEKDPYADFKEQRPC